MRRGLLRRLQVTGANKPPAEINFGPTLTFITGLSNTGKSHIFNCIEFALGGPTPERDFAEARGYNRVLLEVGSGDDVRTIRRQFGRDDSADWFDGKLDEFDDERAIAVSVKGSKTNPLGTLNGRLLDAFGFDNAKVLVRNAGGATQVLSLRTMAPLFLVSEEEIITADSPVAPPSFNATAARSAFNLVISGEAPADAEIEALRLAHEEHERAAQHIGVLEPIIEQLRAEIAEAGTERPKLEASVADIDHNLSELSELVAASGDAVRALLTQRNEAIGTAENARSRVVRAEEMGTRFELLSQHYDSDVKRLEFALETGHFFQQLAASHCPRCGRPLDENEECHEETDDFVAIERAARAEIKKLQPRIADLSAALTDVHNDAEAGRTEQERWSAQAEALDAEIRQVANPTAAQARERVRQLADRRKQLERDLLRHRELARYIEIRQNAELVSKRAVDSFRPLPDAASLRSLQQQIQDTLIAWRFPVVSDVVYDVKADDIVIDGKARASNGKGVRAVTHAAFTVGLMHHCRLADTPHPGFVVIDSPLTPFRGAAGDDEEDPEVRADVHAACLRSIAAANGKGQTIMLENVDPPDGLNDHAAVYVFTGSSAPGRAGFYPPAEQQHLVAGDPD